jgi:hypothetical protein
MQTSEAKNDVKVHIVTHVDILKYGIVLGYLRPCFVCKAEKRKGTITLMADTNIELCLRHVPKAVYWSPSATIIKILRGGPYYYCLNCGKRTLWTAIYTLPNSFTKRFRLKIEGKNKVFELNSKTEFRGDLCKKCLASYVSASAFIEYIKRKE